jgi:hypothetical protein
MTCSQPTTNTTGVLVAWDPSDTGVRPLAANTPFWGSPNIRLALPADLAALSNPANWDIAPYAGWNGQVDTGSTYNLLVRLRNTDTNQQRASLNLQGWVSDYTAGGVGPGSAIRQDPAQPAGPTNPPVSFTGFKPGPLPTPNPANANDPTHMLVLQSNEQWTVNAAQAAVNGGHVCVAVNVYAEATTGDGGTGTPADGGVLVGNFLDPNCDRMYGQRNIQIVTVTPGRPMRVPVMLLVPATDRCPLHAAVGIHRVVLKEAPGGVLEHVPEFALAASNQALTQLRRPDGDPLARVWVDRDGREDRNHDRNGDGDHDDDHDGKHLRVNLEPGERTNVTVTVDARNHRPGDAYALDVITTDTATNRTFGAARIYVLVSS